MTNYSFSIAQEKKQGAYFHNYTTQLRGQTQTNVGKKSVAKAFFLSLILPGLGEAYTGNFAYTKIFLSTETIGWGLAVANILRTDLKVDDYKNDLENARNIRTKKRR